MQTSRYRRALESLRELGTVREALLAEALPEGGAQCNMCQWRCRIRPGGVGHCRTVINDEGRLLTTICGLISSAAADPIEKKPVFHYRPGSRCFSVGSLGCNFRCVFCQNWEIAYADMLAADSPGRRGVLAPADLVAVAHENGCHGVAWTYNEPSIWLNYTLECARLCREAGLYTAYVTNGYSTPQALDLIGPFLDVYRVDIKSTEDRFYRDLIGIPSARGILQVAERARHHWAMHVECVTNIIPGHNDGDENLISTARWISQALGPDTPWHVTRFFPYGKLMHIPPTPRESLERAIEIGRQAGLRYVYLGNTRTDRGENTYCPRCGSLAVERVGYATRIVGVDGFGRCEVDGEDLGIKM